MKNTETSAATAEILPPAAKNGSAARSAASRYIQRNMYRWHRIIGIVTVVPVIFWTLSGLMHPFMAHWFKASIAHEFVRPQAIVKAKLNVSLQATLAQNHVDQLRNFRVVDFAGHTYYQVKTVSNGLVYFSAQDGKPLADGDRKYAQYLARYFVDDQKSSVRIEKITAFDSEYKYINRLLPVWKVSFERGDNMDVFVETEQSRLANFNENKRKVFLWVFSNFHNWDFLAAISSNSLRYMVMIALLGVIILSAISGLVIYGFLWNRFKTPKKGDRKGFLRKYHRQIGIATALVTFTFAFSGAYHATRKFTPDDRLNYVHQPLAKTNELTTSPLELPLDWVKVSNLSLAKIADRWYFQVIMLNEEKGDWKKEQQAKAEKMFDKKSTAEPNIVYYGVQSTSLLENGAVEHAKDLVQRFVAQAAAGGNAACCEPMEDAQQMAAGDLPVLLSTEFISKFDREYGFVNKRLPVVKLSLDTPGKLTYYVEPATGRLAATVTDADRREGVSFAMLHKYFLIDWAGKTVRDLVMMFAAAGVLAVSLFGLALFLKTR